MAISVGAPYKIRDDFNSRGFKARIIFGINGLNVRKAGKLSFQHYQGFLKLLDIIKDQIESSYFVQKGKLLPIRLPGKNELSAIDFERLINDKRAMNAVFNVCVLPDGKFLVDFGGLPAIYKHYFLSLPRDVLTEN